MSFVVKLCVALIRLLVVLVVALAGLVGVVVVALVQGVALVLVAAVQAGESQKPRTTRQRPTQSLPRWPAPNPATRVTTRGSAR